MPSILLALLVAPLLAGGTQVSPATFRVLEWNVSDSAWLQHRDASRAVLRAADPDVLVLVQVAGGTREEAIRDMLTGLRGPSDTRWFVTSRIEGDYERTVIASRDSMRPLPDFAGVVYPRSESTAPGATPPIDEKVPPRDTVRLVRTNGALVRVAGRWILVTGMHLTCCGTPDSWRETRRRLAARLVRDRIRTVLSRESPAAVIIAGDLNLVGGRAALDTLLATVPDPPLGPLRRADAVHPDGWTDWTWDGRGTPFNGGRLDNVLYSSGSLEVARARVWDSEFMDPDTLRAHALAPTTSASIGRHRPVVVDLSFVRGAPGNRDLTPYRLIPTTR